MALLIFSSGINLIVFFGLRHSRKDSYSQISPYLHRGPYLGPSFSLLPLLLNIKSLLKGTTHSTHLNEFLDFSEIVILIMN